MLSVIVITILWHYALEGVVAVPWAIFVTLTWIWMLKEQIKERIDKK